MTTIVNQAAISCGYEELKPEQAASIIINFVRGNDVFGCLLTGFGKSVCFMLLPMIFDAVKARALGESIIIVVSPLTSLMHNKSPSIPKYRLVDMFTSGTHPDVKEIILDSFKGYTAPLRVVICTIAFGLGVDCANVHQL